jgi:hypothetical protein
MPGRVRVVPHHGVHGRSQDARLGWIPRPENARLRVTLKEEKRGGERSVSSYQSMMDSPTATHQQIIAQSCGELGHRICVQGSNEENVGPLS